MIAATDWGNVPAWLGLVFASVALLSYVTSRLDSRRSAASGVHVIPVTFQYSAPKPKEGDHTAYRIVNAGRVPAYDVEVSAWEFGSRRWLWRFRRAPSWMTGARIDARLHIAVLPGQSVWSKGDAELTAPRIGARQSESPVPPLMLIFRDGDGRRWVRWPDGRLNRARSVRF